MSDASKDLVVVSVDGLIRDHRNNPVVLLRADGRDDVLPIWIGQAEGLALEMALKQEAFARPLTHDLLKTSIESLGASVTKVAITELRENTFFAKIYLQRKNEVYVIDSRPSDSIVLAMKTGAQIMVSEDVFANHQKLIRKDQFADRSDEALRRYLEDLDPGDF